MLFIQITTAKIQIEGSVDDAQTGLTTAAQVHYVQNDGRFEYNSRNSISISRYSNH